MLGQCLQAPTQIPFVLAHHDAEEIVFLGNSQQLDHLDLFQTKADFNAQVGDALPHGELPKQGQGSQGEKRRTPWLHWRVIACISFVSARYAALSPSSSCILFTAT